MITDRELVTSILHFSGNARDIVASHVALHAFTLCDGYGSFSLAELREMDILFDWSHVRDSSDKALAAAAFYLREKLGHVGLRAVDAVVNAEGATVAL